MFQPFICLSLNKVPLRSANGSVSFLLYGSLDAYTELTPAFSKLTYFIGGQVNVTGSLVSTGKLSFLLGSEASTLSSEGVPKLNPLEFSLTLQQHRPAMFSRWDFNLFASISESKSSEGAAIPQGARFMVASSHPALGSQELISPEFTANGPVAFRAGHSRSASGSMSLNSLGPKKTLGKLMDKIMHLGSKHSGDDQVSNVFG